MNDSAIPYTTRICARKLHTRQPHTMKHAAAGNTLSKTCSLTLLPSIHTPAILMSKQEQYKQTRIAVRWP
eukprot:1711472-Pyramimonas_sp.AAC.1